MTPGAGPPPGRTRARLAPETLTFAVLRGLTMIGGLAALSIVPLRPEHDIHLLPLLGAFIAYKGALLLLLSIRPGEARPILLATLGTDLGAVFFLVWFTGGGESHFYLLFLTLVALNGYHFGPGIGVLAAALSGGLMALANVLAFPAAPWSHIAARAALFLLLGLALGHIARREGRARAALERVNEELRSALADVDAATDRALRAEQLAAAGRTAARMAHEVRSPISAIGLNAEMLEDIVTGSRGSPTGEARELLRGIRAEVKRLSTLTEEYLTFARLPAARCEEDALNEMVEELLGFLRPEALSRHVRLEAALDPGVPLFSFDRDLIRRAALNLLKNAVEATPRGGQVVVATRLCGTSVELAVTDTGGGIDDRHAPHLFEPFYTTKPRGTGLGLVIARQIAEEHGGGLGWENLSGGGARFVLRIPLAMAGVNQRIAAAERVPAASSGGLTHD